MTGSSGDDFSNGVTLLYNGQGTFRARVDMTCDPQASSWLVDVLSDTVTFSPLTRTWNYRVNTRRACPDAFARPPVPQFDRVKDSGQKTWKRYWHKDGSSEQFGLNIRELGEGREVLIVEAENLDGYHKAQVHYSPVKRVKCPSGLNCGRWAKEKANLWLCLPPTPSQTNLSARYSECYPVGDSDYGVNVRALSVENHTFGVQARYAGGVSRNGSRLVASIHFWCDESMEHGDVRWFRLPAEQGTRDMGLARETNTEFTFYAHTREACPFRWEPPSVQGGAIFCVVVALLCVLYFGVGGVISWALGGSIVPNEEFWDEVAKSLIAALSFLFRCGKIDVGLSYDKI